VVFADDIFALPADRVADAQVAYTVMDGQVVYQRDLADTTAP
jgi:predicted amidohydrolase YtcJ